MQQIIKMYHPFRWMITIIVVTVFVWGCNDASTKTEEKSIDTTPVKVAPIDTLPPIDKSATTRPEDRKT